jgi:8-oxo-dGTP pyrophosphatase MutT (NUDIX family)
VIAAVYVAFIRGDSVLLIRRHATGYRDGSLTLVGGHLEDFESVADGAAREAREEVGVLVAPDSLSIACVIHRWEDGSRIDFLTVCYEWEGDPYNAEPGKCSGLMWVDMASLPADVVPYVAYGLKSIGEGVSFASLGWESAQR